MKGLSNAYGNSTVEGSQHIEDFLTYTSGLACVDFLALEEFRYSCGGLVMLRSFVNTWKGVVANWSSCGFGWLTMCI